MHPNGRRPRSPAPDLRKRWTITSSYTYHKVCFVGREAPWIVADFVRIDREQATGAESPADVHGIVRPERLR